MTPKPYRTKPVRFPASSRRSNPTGDFLASLDLGAIGDDNQAPLGEWLGQSVGRDRSSLNDPLVALAKFVYDSTTYGCVCEECDNRRAIAVALVFSPSVDDQAIHDAFEG